MSALKSMEGSTIVKIDKNNDLLYVFDGSHVAIYQAALSLLLEVSTEDLQEIIGKIKMIK